MQYQSTRDKNLKAGSAQAVLNGLAPDGGLYTMPSFDEARFDYREVLDLDTFAMSARILSKLLPDFSEEEMTKLVHDGYAGKFETDHLTPTVSVGEDHILELFRGPTSAFKDVALSMLPRLMTAAKGKCGFTDEIMILTATSGDTGKAAMEGFCNVPGTRIIVFYPYGGVSAVQQAQMATQAGENVCVCAVRGNFDDAQTGVKNIFASVGREGLLKGKGVSLSSANSINIGRLAPQVVYYYRSYADLVKAGRIQPGDKVDFVVPTGNFGDILAGWYAKEMGLPVGKLICASNANNVLTDFIRTGTYNKNRPFHTTASPSMDILVSSNLERLLYALCGSDTEVAGYMQQLREQGSYTVSDALKAKIQEVFAGSFCNDIQTREKIGHAWRDHRYLIDTHTAVAYHVLDDYRRETGDTTPSVVVSTASPFKFCDQVLRGIGGTADAFGPALIRRLSCETQIDAPAPLTGLDARPVRFGGCVDKAQMLHTVDEFLK